MPPIILFEDEGFRDLLPLVFWRSVFELRVGRKIILDRVAQCFGAPIAGVWTRDWIARVAGQRCGAPANLPLKNPSILVNGRWICDPPVELPAEPCVARTADGGVAFIFCDEKLAARLRPSDLIDPARRDALLRGLPQRRAPGRMLCRAWELIEHLPQLLSAEWNPEEACINSDVDKKVVVDAERVHVGERVRIHGSAVLDAREGPVFVSDDVEIGPCAVIEGPAYIGPGAKVNPHAWLHGGNAIGPVCKIGGEVCGCIISGYSNKQHHGFLGHSCVGSWVNIGAGATNSNLKNTYGTVRVPINGRTIDSGLQFFGAIIADHAKIGINAAIPTGAVIGFSASVAATGPIPKYVPSFGWITGDSMSPGDHLRALDVATAVMARRKVDMTDEEIELFLDLGQRVREFEIGPSVLDNS